MEKSLEQQLEAARNHIEHHLEVIDSLLEKNERLRERADAAESLKREVDDLKSAVLHLEDSNRKLYAGRDCPSCGKRVNMHTESDLVLVKQKDLEKAIQMKRSLLEVAELICDAGPLAWVHARPEHVDYLRFMESANEWEKRAAAWLRGAKELVG